MLPLTAKEVAELCGGRLAEGDADALATGVSIDTRTLRPGDLFVPLAGRHVDGHAFLKDALARGAAVVLAREGADAPGDAPVVRVHDPATALARLAAAVRLRLGATVVAITGSSGKTVTKDFASAVARAGFRTAASEASFNNEIGVPLTILAAGSETEVLVAEVGSRGIGHIAALMPVVRPDIGVVTNVGIAHLGMFGTEENIAKAKGELVEALSPEGTAILNADVPAVAAMASRTRASVLTFGVSGGADVRAERIAADDGARASFVLALPGGEAPVRLTVPGEHMVSNALAAAAVGWRLGLAPGTIAEALGAARGPAWRMEVADAPGGWRVVNDAYNANPASMAAALRTLAAMGRGRRTWAVLGAMAELGRAAGAEHDRVGRLVARLGVARLVAVGEEARAICRAARLEGMAPEGAATVAGVAEAVALLERELAPGDVVLVKASRAAGLERVALAIGGGEGSPA